MSINRSSAWPLAWSCAAVIVYASLHPFTGWTLLGPLSWKLLVLPWPPYNPVSDMLANALGYLPLAFLSCSGWQREGAKPPMAWLISTAQAAALSYTLEVLQHTLPTRVPSLLDWLLNSGGAACGAGLALAVHRWHGIDTLRNWRNRWVVPHTAGGQTLLLLWPAALLFPPPIPLGLGQVISRLNEALRNLLEGSAYAGWLAEPQHLEPLAPGTELLVVSLGLLAPTLVSFTLTRLATLRLLLMLGATLTGALVTTLSTAMSFGPDHAFSWLTAPVAPGLAAGVAVGVVLAWFPRRVLAGLGLVVLCVLCALVNLSPSDPYYALSLQSWEQGRFIRFHGLAQWIGWLWPYLAMVWLLSRLSAQD